MQIITIVQSGRARVMCKGDPAKCLARWEKSGGEARVRLRRGRQHHVGACQKMRVAAGAGVRIAAAQAASVGNVRDAATGGASRNRTDLDGFAIRCITTLPLRLYESATSYYKGHRPPRCPTPDSCAARRLTRPAGGRAPRRRGLPGLAAGHTRARSPCQCGSP